MAGLRALEDQSIIDEYIKLKAERDAIDERLNEIRPEIAAAVDSEDPEGYQHGDFHFSTSFRTTWDFAHIDVIQDLKEELKHHESIAKRNAERTIPSPGPVAKIKKQSIVLTMKWKPQGTAIR